MLLGQVVLRVAEVYVWRVLVNLVVHLYRSDLWHPEHQHLFHVELQRVFELRCRDLKFGVSRVSEV